MGPIVGGEMVQGLVLALALGAARSVPIVLLVPGFGGRALPAPLRVGIGLLLASFSLPHLTLGTASLMRGPGLGAWLLIAAREVLTGATVGLVVSFFFRAAEAAGGLVDVLRGSSFAEVLAPDSGARSSPTGALYLLLATVIFLELGGIGRLAVALARSYEALPLGGGPGAPAVGVESQLQVMLAASAKLVESAVGLAAPVIVALLLADVALGVVGRVTPALPVYFAAMPLKGVLSIGVVLLGLAALDAALVAGWPAWITLAERALGLHSR